jgi:spore protease
MTNNLSEANNILGPDLAIEAHEMLQSKHDGEIPGVSLEKTEFSQGTTAIIRILNEEGAAAMGKPQGTYITLEAPKLSETDRTQHEPIVSALCEALKTIMSLKEQASVLIAGLGNNLTIPDALGPMVTSRLLATRHLFIYGDASLTEGLRSIALITPGVTGTTGLETAEILEALVKQMEPDCLLCIDALAAGELSRLHNTIQLTDAGIHPGSGIGNKRKSINKDTIGIPVIALGVPTVVGADIIAYHAIDALISILEKPQSKREMPLLVSKEHRETIVQQILEPFGGQLMVTPKDIDEQVDHTAQIIAKALTLAIHPSVTYEDAEYYLH